MFDVAKCLTGWMVRGIAPKDWRRAIVRGLSLVIVLAAGPAIATSPNLESSSAPRSKPIFEMASAPSAIASPFPDVQPNDAPLPFSDPGDLFNFEVNQKGNEDPHLSKEAPAMPKPVAGKTLGDRVVAAAIAAEGADVTMGPGRGSLACAWAVNRFGLQPVLGQKMGSNPNLVVSVRAALLKQGLAKEIPQSAAQPGDIVVAAGPGRSQHIGIVVSKRSGRGVEALSTRGGRWGWRSDLNFEMKYKAKGQVYRLVSPAASPKIQQSKPLEFQPVIASEVPAQPLFASAPEPKVQSSTAVSRSLTFTPSDQAISFDSTLTIPGAIADSQEVAPTGAKPAKNPKPIGGDSAVHQWFADRRSLGAVAIGHAEGNLSAAGKIRSIYYGHNDPGNGVKNIGFCSLQRYLWQDFNGDGQVSFPEADRRCLDLLRAQGPKTAAKLLDFGYTAANHPEVTINCLDLYNQSRVAGRQCPKRYRQARDRGLTGERAIVWARVESFRVLKGRNKGKLSASGLFRICRRSRDRRHLANWDCIASDQRRRVRAIRRVFRSQV
ncbi:MAG: hypothetical protein AAF889_01760 [Cyanobacteria bacterium P01_D01_bin.73]